jgi:two-component system sensor histidine kinase KdpD
MVLPDSAPARAQPGSTTLPLLVGTESLGSLVLAPSPAEEDTRQLAQAFAAQAALAIERARLARAARSAELRARTEEMRSTLLSAVSHDLRTPLAAITGAATTLRDGDSGLDAEQRADLADTICVEAERLERFVGNLLEMTRVDAGALEVKREWIPLEEPIGSALTRLESKLAGRSIHVPLPLEFPLVWVDPVLLEQVFYNLLENATKYTPAGSSLEISARVAESELVIELSDHGPGLPAGPENQVFERFFRGPGTGTRGAGLGLAICRGIVQAHGGTIIAENRVEGGATFRVTLPLEGSAPSVPAEEEPLPDKVSR